MDGREGQGLRARFRRLCGRPAHSRRVQRHSGAGAGAQSAWARPGRRGDRHASELHCLGFRRDDDRGNPRLRRCRSRQRQHHGGNHCANDRSENSRDPARASGRLAVRHAGDHGPRRPAWAQGDRGLRPGPRSHVDGRQTGSFGDAAAFSFCQDKIITTGGEGGMVAFKDRARLVARLELQGPRQELRARDGAARAPRLPLACTRASAPIGA